MATRHQEQNLRALAEALEEVLEETYGQKMGFFLNVFVFGQPGVSDYVSNGLRDDCIAALRECADKLERGLVIPAAEGEG